jgi:protein-tyrosine phosphatase
MYKVLMVCLGNICRSPLAEGILKSKVNPDQVFVDSAGTAAYHVGELPDERSISTAADHGIDLTDQRARQFVQEDFDRFDRILVMDKSNYQNVLKLAVTKEHRSKVSLILDFLNDDRVEVPDPYYGGMDGFEKVYQMLDQSCDVFVNSLEL